jgi:D-apionolactonase
LRLRYEAGEIRDLWVGGVEVLRRVYPVFQDRNWTARPWEVDEESITREAGGFRVRARGHGTFDAAGLSWSVTIDGSADGSVSMSFHAKSSEPFLRNRLGLCVLYPVRGLAGAAVEVEHVDGSIEASHFPLEISPDQPFTDVRSLSHDVVPGLRASVRMDGETFESEDHRNWSDASYKIYCTPIGLPFPVEVQSGDVIDQRVTITLTGDGVPAPLEPLRIDVLAEPVTMPALGLQLDHDGHVLDSREVELLRGLRLDHVRVDLHEQDEPERRLIAAVAQAQELDTRLVVALHGLDPKRFRGVADDAAIDRWMLFDPSAKVSDPIAVARAQEILGERVTGGTSLYFTELNRGRPESRGFIAFSANPQVHAWDDTSVMQNAWTLGVIAQQARILYPDAFLELSPLTLRPRWNPNATAPELDVSNTALPSRVDARQCMPFAAAWIVLALSSLANASTLNSVTLFESTGWEGVIERASGSPQPEDFASMPGEPFPVYEVLRRIAGERQCLRTVSSDSDTAAALALADGTVIVANATAQAQRVLVKNVNGEGVSVDLPAHGVVILERMHA